MTNDGVAVPERFFLCLSGAGYGPWETGWVQPSIIKLVERDIFHGEVLDVGCGVADNAVYIATHTNDIHLTSIDLVPKAIEVAREKAKKNKVNIRFEVVNMLDDISKTNILQQHSYDIVLDSACFHGFSNEERLRFIKNIEYLIKPGGLYIQIGYSEKEMRPGAPRRIAKSDLNQLFSSETGWTIESIEDIVYETKPQYHLGPFGLAYLSFIRRN